MPKLSNKTAHQQEKKVHLANILKAQKGIRDFTEEQMGKTFLKMGRSGYRSRIKDPGTTTLNEMFFIADKLNMRVPELLGYVLDEKEKSLV